MSYPAPTNEKYKAPVADLVTLPEGEVITSEQRSIRPDTYALYGVTTEPDSGGYIYPYTTDGKLIGYKVRLKNPKRFPFEGERECVTMFRPRTQLSGNKYLIITEGEHDAMAAHQLTGYTAWSVPFGASSAAKYIKRALREIETYENVYIAFDNDEPGLLATSEVMSLIDPTKVKQVKFPPGIKDFNQLARDWEKAPDSHSAGSAERYAHSLLWGAQGVVIDGVIDQYTAGITAAEWYFDREQRIGLPTGYNNLDALFGGWRGGEFIVLVGGTGSSKSTTARHLVYRQQKLGVDCAYITLEDTVPLALTRFLEIQQQCDLIKSETPVLTREQFAQAVTNLDRVHIADGMVMQDLAESIKRSVSYYARTGVKFIVLDHLTAVSDQLPLAEFNQFVRELYRLAGEHSVCLVAISHMARDNNDKNDNEPSLKRVKNSSAIAQWSTCVLGLTRDRNSNLVRLSTLKNSRTWGVCGECYFTLNSETMQLEECDPPLDEGRDETSDEYNGSDEW